MNKFTRNDIFSTDGWLPVNKKLAHMVGLEAAAIYGELNRKEKWYFENNKTLPGGWFFVTQDDLEASTAIKRRGQDNGIKKLEEAGLIEKKVAGMPARRYFRLLDITVSPNRTNQLAQNEQTGMDETDKSDCSNCTPNNNRTNNNNLNNNNNNNQSSLEADIEKIKVPLQIKQPLIKNQKRLIDDNINILDIEKVYEGNKNHISDSELSMILSSLLENIAEPIRNITLLLRKSISNHLKDVQQPKKEAQKENSEVMPEWFKEQKQAKIKRNLNDLKEQQKESEQDILNRFKNLIK